MNRRKIVIPVLVLIGAALGSLALVRTAPVLENVTPERMQLTVRVIDVEPEEA